MVVSKKIYNTGDSVHYLVSYSANICEEVITCPALGLGSTIRDKDNKTQKFAGW